MLNVPVEQRFTLTLHPPSPELSEYVEHFWCVRWDLRGRDAVEQHTLPHPSVHLVAERDKSGIFGIQRGRFTRVLEGLGRAFGIKFRPAGFRPFLGGPVSRLTRRVVPVASVFGAAGDALVGRLLTVDDDPQLVETAAVFLCERQPLADPSVEMSNALVAQCASDRSITRVVHLVERCGVGERQLQRLFNEYVGVGPKWVIQRYRLIEAAELVANGESIDFAALAQELGYFDQAHFSHDFRSVVGQPPFEYARRARPSSAHRERVER